MKKFLILNLFLLVSLASCAAWNLSPDKKQELQKTYASMLAENKITSAQYQALMDALEHGTTAPSFLNDALQSAIDIGLALLGVRVWRGGIQDRKGTPPATSEITATTTTTKVA